MSPETDLEPYEITNIYISQPHYDDMGEILDQIEVSYRNLSEVESDRGTEAVMMINCGSDSWEIDADTFSTFVKRGGSAIVSDWAGRLLNSFTDASFDSSTEKTTLTASVEDNELAELLGKQELSLEPLCEWRPRCWIGSQDR
jgi:hypothetical protein